MKSVAVYLRVSTSEQSVENQLPAIRDYCEAQAWQITEVYQENESAWRAGHQKDLARLLSDIRSGRRKFDYLVIWSLDGLSRQGVGALLQLVNTFESLGCKVISIKESFTNDNTGIRDLFLAVIAWVSKFESDRRSERTRAGLERVRKNGRKV